MLEFTRAIKPVQVRYEDQEWISTAGTCFLITYKGRYFAVTATHCLAQAGADFHGSGDWIIPVSVTADEIVALASRGYHQLVRCAAEPDSSINDLAAMEISVEASTRETLSHVSFIPISDFQPSCLVGQRFVAFGYPLAEQSADYTHVPIVSVQLNDLNASFERTNGDGTHTLKVDQSFGNGTILKSLNGFSGGPVFQVTKDKSGTFVGTIVRGTHDTAGRLTFVPKSVLVEFLERIISPT